MCGSSGCQFFCCSSCHGHRHQPMAKPTGSTLATSCVDHVTYLRNTAPLQHTTRHTTETHRDTETHRHTQTHTDTHTETTETLTQKQQRHSHRDRETETETDRNTHRHTKHWVRAWQARHDQQKRGVRSTRPSRAKGLNPSPLAGHDRGRPDHHPVEKPAAQQNTRVGQLTLLLTAV